MYISCRKMFKSLTHHHYKEHQIDQFLTVKMLWENMATSIFFKCEKDRSEVLEFLKGLTSKLSANQVKVIKVYK